MDCIQEFFYTVKRNSCFNASFHKLDFFEFFEAMFLIVIYQIQFSCSFLPTFCSESYFGRSTQAISAVYPINDSKASFFLIPHLF